MLWCLVAPRVDCSEATIVTTSPFCSVVLDDFLSLFTQTATYVHMPHSRHPRQDLFRMGALCDLAATQSGVPRTRNIIITQEVFRN